MKALKIASVVALVGASAAGIGGLHAHNNRLRGEVANERQRNQALAGAQEENRRLRALLENRRRGEAEAAVTLRADLEGARHELAELERAAPKPAGPASAAGAPQVSRLRNPEKELVRLEDFENRGRVSPAAALQTAIWAAVKGDEDVLAASLVLDGPVREKAEALFATLPSAARAKYQTPEKLVGLFFAAEVLATAEQVQIMAPRYEGTDRAMVGVMNNHGTGAMRPMRLGANGWQIVVPERAIDSIRHQLRRSDAPQ